MNQQQLPIDNKAYKNDCIAVLLFLDNKAIGEATERELYGVCGGKNFKRWCDARRELMERELIIRLPMGKTDLPQEYRLTANGENLVNNVVNLLN